MFRYYVRGHSYRQIAEWAGTPVSTMRNRIRRGAEIMTEYNLMPSDWVEIDQKRRESMSRD